MTALIIKETIATLSFVAFLGACVVLLAGLPT